MKEFILELKTTLYNLHKLVNARELGWLQAYEEMQQIEETLDRAEEIYLQEVENECK